MASDSTPIIGDPGGTSNALHRRDQQLKRWKEYEETQSPYDIYKNPLPKIKFSNSTLFLASCASNDYNECKRLLENNLVDINCATVDGLTALHQACIDGNVKMVSFLLDYGADINCCDNEGWTPLHAAVSCSHDAITRLLLERGADPRLVNNEGELATDLAPENSIVHEMFNSRWHDWGVYDLEVLREQERLCMLQDVNDWIKTGVVGMFYLPVPFVDRNK